jgi:hypothetical protein
MAGITLAQAEARLQNYLDAEEAVLTGQSYQIAGRQMTRANLAEIQAGIALWNSRVNQLSQSTPGPRVRGAVPMD